MQRRQMWRAPAIALVLGLAMSGCGESEPVLPGVQALVFASRSFVNEDLSENVNGGNGQTIDYLRYVPGGALYVLEPPTPDGTLTDLTADFEGVDVNGLDVSFDATQVAFSMRHADDNRYHIYVANLDGSGVRQLTFGDYHDVNPLWLPGDRIAFVTNEPYTAMGTRADEYNHSRVVTQIGTISANSGDADRRLCSQNLSHTATMALDHDGTIVYSRWEHLGPVNDVKLFRMNPDCTGMVAVAGQFNKRFNSVVQCEPEAEPGTYVCIGTSRSGTIQAGSMMFVDARSATSDNPALYFDVQQATFTSLTPDVPTGDGRPADGVGRYRSPLPFGDGRYLVSWADGPVNDRAEQAQTAPDFGVYLFDPETGRRTLVYNDTNMWDLYAVPVAPREEPPVIRPTVEANPDPTEPAVLGSIDVTQTSLNERVRGAQFGDGVPLSEALGESHRMRIIEGFSSEIGVGQFGLTMHEGAAILGETRVWEDGSWRAQVPAFLPYHLQPLDRYGLAIRNQMLWIQAMPGETRTCGGCHASRSETVQPRMGTQTLAQQVDADPDTFRTIADRIELPWYGAPSGENIQDIFDANCVSCHGGDENDVFAGEGYTVTVTTMEGEELEYLIPYLDLSDRLLETVYEDEAVTYPASYISLLYPSAMMGDVTITGGRMPPEWVVPGSARGSELIRKLNMSAENGDPATGDLDDLAWVDLPMHPEDQGVTLSREDRLSLIRMADNGGQYWSRRNVDGDWRDLSEEY